MEVILNLDNIDRILSLRKSEQLLLFKLVALIKASDKENLIILETTKREEIAKELNVQVLSLNATLSRLTQKNILIRKSNSVYTIDKDILRIL